ncbi:MAG: DUF748 domain-containing protein, partial [Pseudomonadota bacterium]
SGQVELRGRELPNTRRYLDYYLPFDLAFKGISGDFRYEAWVDEGGLGATITGFHGSLDELALQVDDGDDTLVTVTRVEAAGGRFDLRDQAGHLEQLAISGLGVDAVLRADGSINVFDLLPPESADAAAPSDEPLALSLSLAELDVRGDRIDIRVETFDPPLAAGLRDLELALTGIDLEDGTLMPLTTTTSLASGGTVSFEGEVQAFPDLSADGRVAIDALALAIAQPFVDSIARARIDAGTLDLQAEMQHGPDQLLDLGGELSVNDLDVHDQLRDEKLAGWERLSLERFEVDLAEERVDTSVLEFSGLYGRFHIAEDLTTNVGDLLIASETDPATETSPDTLLEGLPAISIGGIAMAGTALDFSDFSLPLPFEAAIRDMEGEISTLATTSTEPATVALDGQVNEFGEARIEGELNAWDPTQQTDIRMQFRNLEISRLTPYTVQFAGYAIADGRLDTDLGYRLENRQLQGENGIVIREMALGEKVDHPDAGNLPLGLAIALLKDSEGVIDLDVPVEGDLDNPEFGIGSVVLQALGNIITKAVTAPFRLLGSLVGIESEDFGTLAFQPGEAELSPPDREQLLKLNEAMAQRPELTLDIAGTWVPELDRPALQEAFLDEAVENWQAENPGDEDELSTERDRRTLEALYLARGLSPGAELLISEHSAPPADDPEGAPVLDEPAYLAALRGGLLAATAVSTADFEALAQARSAAVVAALTPETGEVPGNIREVAPVAMAAEEDTLEAENVPLELAVSVED